MAAADRLQQQVCRAAQVDQLHIEAVFAKDATAGGDRHLGPAKGGLVPNGLDLGLVFGRCGAGRNRQTARQGCGCGQRGRPGLGGCCGKACLLRHGILLEGVSLTADYRGCYKEIKLVSGKNNLRLGRTRAATESFCRKRAGECFKLCADVHASGVRPCMPGMTGAAPREDVGAWRGVVAWSWDADAATPALAVVQAMRMEIGRPSSSIRLSAWTATSTSVARRWSVRERSPWPITCLNRLMAASARDRFV